MTINVTDDVTDDKRERIFGYICEHWRRNLQAPTLREICDGAFISSTSVVSYHIDALESTGRLQREYGLARSLHPTGMTVQIPQ